MRPWVRRALGALELQGNRTASEFLRSMERARAEMLDSWLNQSGQGEVTLARLNELTYQADGIITNMVADLARTNNNAIFNLAHQEATHALEDLRRIMPRAVADSRLLNVGPRIPEAMVREIATNAGQSIQAIGNDLRLGIRRELTQSMIRGEGAAKAARRILARPADEPQLSLEGIRPVFKSVRDRAMTIARTELVNTSNAVHLATYTEAEEEFDDLEMEWNSALCAGRTCALCRNLNGQRRKPSEVQANPYTVVHGSKTLRFVRPTAHPKCLCRLIPWFPEHPVVVKKPKPKPVEVEQPVVEVPKAPTPEELPPPVTEEPKAPKPKKPSTPARDFSGLEIEDMDKEIRRILPVAKSFSRHERYAVMEYKDDMYRDINTKLRGNGDDTFAYKRRHGLKSLSPYQAKKHREDLRDITSNLDAALKKSKLPEDVMLYRGVNSEGLVNKLKAALESGESFKDKAFVSTTMDKGTASKFANLGNSTVGLSHRSRALIEIRAKKGTQALYLEGFNNNIDELEEAEILLKRGQAFTVTGMRKEGDFTVFEVQT